MVRHPLEVAASLHRRDQLGKNRSLLLWATYMLACEQDTRGQNRIFVRYDDLLARGEAVVDRIEETLNVEFPRRTWQASIEIEEFLSAEHRHHALPAGDSSLGRFPEIDQFHGYLESLARGEPWNVDAAGQLDAWMKSLGRYVGPIFKTFERDLRERTAALDAERHASAEAARALEAVRAELNAAQESVGRSATEAEAAGARASELEAALLAAEQRKAELEAEAAAMREEVARSLAEFEQRASDAHSAATAREEALNAAAAAAQRHVEELEADVVQLRAEHDAALQAESAVAARANQELVERGRAELRAAQEQSEALARELLSTISNQRRRPWWALRRQ
jgi:hypothetical protein